MFVMESELGVHKAGVLCKMHATEADVLSQRPINDT